jgi:hypothetical protein
VPVQVIRDVLSVVLSVYLPKRLQVLSRHHLQPAVAPWMPGEVRDVEHTPHERDDDAALRARQFVKMKPGLSCAGGAEQWAGANLLADELVDLVQRHDAVPAAHPAGHFAVAAARLGEEVEALMLPVVFAVVTAYEGGSRVGGAVISALDGCLRGWRDKGR